MRRLKSLSKTIKMSKKEQEIDPIKEKIHEIIFEADTSTGKLFDVVLLVAIIASVITVMLESVEAINKPYHHIFVILEWFFTILFTIEYGLRLYAVRSKIKYATSFYGIIDLLSILPTYLSLLFTGSQYLLVIRALRLLRVFRIFKLGQYMKEADIIANALKASRTKISVFILFVLILVTIMGSIMYLVESEKNSDFTSIPRSIYWAIVTLTTVGYGDISPTTTLGQFLSSIVMILGYAVIAVPTGIVSAEFIKDYKEVNSIACRNCSEEGHDNDADYCKYCGEQLHE